MVQYTNWRELPTAPDMISYAQFYADTVSNIQGKYFVELGIRDGVSTRIIMDALGDQDYKLYLVDLVRSKLIEEVVPDPRVEFFEGSAEESVKYFKARSISFLHIDIDPHEFEQTKNIFELYKPKVKRNGVVMFHDCTPSWGVWDFVNGILDKDPEWQVEFCPPGEIFPHTAPAKALRLR